MPSERQGRRLQPLLLSLHVLSSLPHAQSLSLLAAGFTDHLTIGQVELRIEPESPRLKFDHWNGFNFDVCPIRTILLQYL
jgi:hypothetical protein